METMCKLQFFVLPSDFPKSIQLDVLMKKMLIVLSYLQKN